MLHTPPATPAEDVSAYQSRPDRIAAGSPISAELAAFMQSGLSVTLASVSADLHPIAGFGLACRIDPTGTMRLLLRKPANLMLLDMVAQGRPLAVTLTRPHDHRSIQVKAPAARIAAVRPDDLPEIARQTANMRDELIDGAYDPVLSAAYVAYEPGEVVALELKPERIFVQTPGPGAGSELVP
ncbi:MAG: hypothetical protein ACK4UO_02245 [Pseudolabrys sp.]